MSEWSLREKAGRLSLLTTAMSVREVFGSKGHLGWGADPGFRDNPKAIDKARKRGRKGK